MSNKPTYDSLPPEEKKAVDTYLRRTETNPIKRLLPPSDAWREVVASGGKGPLGHARVHGSNNAPEEPKGKGR